MNQDRQEPRSSFVDVGALRVHYLDWGSAGRTPMILLHGLRGHAHSWDDLAPAFSSTHHVLALDFRGRGLSDWAPNGEYNLDAYVRDLKGFLDGLRIGKCVLVAHSMGALVTMTFCDRHPDLVHAAVLMEMGPENDPKGTERLLREFREMPEEFASFDEALADAVSQNPLASRETLKTRVEFQTKPLENGRVGWRYDRVIRDQWRNPKRPPRPDLWPVVARMKCPTLIVRGAQTDIFPAAVAKRMVDVMPRAKLVEVRGAAHMVNEEKPQECIDAMRQFLEKDAATP